MDAENDIQESSESNNWKHMPLETVIVCQNGINIYSILALLCSDNILGGLIISFNKIVIDIFVYYVVYKVVVNLKYVYFQMYLVYQM